MRLITQDQVIVALTRVTSCQPQCLLSSLMCATELWYVIYVLQVVSVYETSLPYSLDPHTLETLGMETFNGALTLKAFAAHFRLDMRAGVCV